MDYVREGDGPALVLLSSLGCDARVWRPVGEQLKDRFTTIYSKTWNQVDVHAGAQLMWRTIGELGVSVAGVAGFSAGGYVALDFLRNWPEKVRAVALLDTTAFADDPERLAQGREMSYKIRGGGLEEVLDALSAATLTPANAAGGTIRDLIRAMGRELGTEIFLSDLEATLKRGSYADVLRLIRVPALFVYGELDTVTPPEVGRRMAAQVPGSRFELIPGVAHMSILENPDRVAEILRDFFGTSLSPQAEAVPSPSPPISPRAG
jgi:pimeloyl-ACP methyl ester carboxylesterase